MLVFAPALITAQSPLVKNDDCSGLKFTLPQVISFHSGDFIQIELDRRTQKGKYVDQVYLVNSKGKQLLSTKPDKGVYSFPVNRVDKGSYIVYDDECGTRKVAAVISDIERTPNTLTISGDYHDFLKSLLDNQNRISHEELYSQVVNSPFSKVEKMAMIQQHFMDGRPVFEPDDFFDQKIVFDRTKTGKSLAKCDCTSLLVPAEDDLNPGDIPNALGENGIFLPGQNTGQPNPRHVPNVNELEIFQAGVGPAKTWFGYSDGWSRPTGVWFGGTFGNDVSPIDITETDVSPNLGNRIGQRVTLFCSGGSSNTSDECECEKEIVIDWFYESTVDVRAQQLRTGAGNRAIALGEDVAVAWAVMEKERNEEPELVIRDIVRNRRVATCNTPPQGNLGREILTATTVAATIASFIFRSDFLGDNPTVPQQTAYQALQASLVQQSFTQLNNLLDQDGDGMNDPIATDMIGCSIASAGVPAIMDPRPMGFTILPGRTLYFGISSGARITSQGTKNWQSEVIVKSDFYLATFYPRGSSSGNFEPDCCSPYFEGHFWNKGIPTEWITNNYEPDISFSFIPPSDEIELRSKVARFYTSTVPYNTFNFPVNEQGDYTVLYDYAHVVSESKQDEEVCKLEQEGSDPFPDIGGIIPGFNDQGNGSTGKSFSSNEFDLIVFDLTGRQVGASVVNYSSATNNDELDMQAMNHQLSVYCNKTYSNKLPHGIYLASLRNSRTGQFITSHKILIQ